MPPARIVFWASTIGAIALAVWTILVAPPPVGLSVACGALYAAVLLSGVLVLRLRMFVDAIVRGPQGARGVVLTFDDGPHPAHTREVLDALDARDAKATFFVICAKAERHPDLVAEIVRRGHEVGVHGFSHDRLFSLRGGRRVRADLARAVRVLEDITGTRPTLFRPPVGHTNPAIARAAEALDLAVVGWSVRGRDGLSGATPADVVARVSPGLDDGAIVLLHDAAERGDRKPAGVEALGAVLDRIAAKNLRVVPLSSWLAEEAEGARH